LQGWLPAKSLQISASRVARIIGMSHQHPASFAISLSSGSCRWLGRDTRIPEELDVFEIKRRKKKNRNDRSRHTMVDTHTHGGERSIRQRDR
jgi:hypothetical protein